LTGSGFVQSRRPATSSAAADHSHPLLGCLPFPLLSSSKRAALPFPSLRLHTSPLLSSIRFPLPPASRLPSPFHARGGAVGTTTSTSTSIRAPLARAALAGGAPPARRALLLLVPGPGGRRGGGAHGARWGRVGGHRPPQVFFFSHPLSQLLSLSPPSIWLTSPWGTRGGGYGASEPRSMAAGTNYTVPPSPACLAAAAVDSEHRNY
jgi:hypothetical protein